MWHVGLENLAIIYLFIFVYIPIHSTNTHRQSAIMDVDSLREELAQHEQEHLLEFWQDLDENQKQDLYNDIKGTDIGEVLRFFKKAMENVGESEKVDEMMEPIPSEQFGSVTRSGKELEKWYNEGKQRLL